MILELSDVSKFYRQTRFESLVVLKNISFCLDRGQTLAVIGQSGSGKTTLLSLIAGLDSPDSGRIMLEGKDISAMKEKELSRYRAARTSIIFQQFHLMPHLTAEENISLPLEILKQKKIRELTHDMLEKVGLWDRRHHLPGALSGGECQRVAIARALVVKPALLLADEPTGNLDMETGEKIARLLFDLVEKENKTLILVTHNPALASRCREIKILEKGCLV